MELKKISISDFVNIIFEQIDRFIKIKKDRKNKIFTELIIPTYEAMEVIHFEYVSFLKYAKSHIEKYIEYTYSIVDIDNMPHSSFGRDIISYFQEGQDIRDKNNESLQNFDDERVINRNTEAAFLLSIVGELIDLRKDITDYKSYANAFNERYTNEENTRKFKIPECAIEFFEKSLKYMRAIGGDLYRGSPRGRVINDLFGILDYLYPYCQHSGFILSNNINDINNIHKITELLASIKQTISKLLEKWHALIVSMQEAKIELNIP